MRTLPRRVLQEWRVAAGQGAVKALELELEQELGLEFTMWSQGMAPLTQPRSLVLPVRNVARVGEQTPEPA